MFKGKTIQRLEHRRELFILKYMKNEDIELNNIKAIYTFFFLLKFLTDFSHSHLYIESHLLSVKQSESLSHPRPQTIAA